MTTLIPPRLLRPAVYLLAGAILAVAWAVRGGPLWWVSILAAVLAVIRAIVTYVRAGQDSDEGALAGSRADERLALVTARSRALAGTLAAVASFIGLSWGIAARANWWWPFGLMLGVLALGYLFGLSNFGFADEGSAEDGAPGPQAASPVRR